MEYLNTKLLLKMRIAIWSNAMVYVQASDTVAKRSNIPNKCYLILNSAYKIKCKQNGTKEKPPKEGEVDPTWLQN